MDASATIRPSAIRPPSHGERRAALHALLDGLEGALVAFSGGVDSGVLLDAARARLGPRAAAAIGVSASLAQRELRGARTFCAALGVELIEVATDELADPGYVANAGLRCFHCKDALFRSLVALARERRLGRVIYGENADDLLVERAGRRAAAEHGVLAPLALVGFAKADVRRYARERGLSLADKPASPCLASRLPLFSPVSAARLARVEAAEEALRALGLDDLRVRDHGRRARVELAPSEFQRAERARIAEALAPLGFENIEIAAYVAPAERRPGALTGRQEGSP